VLWITVIDDLVAKRLSLELAVSLVDQSPRDRDVQVHDASEQVHINEGEVAAILSHKMCKFELFLSESFRSLTLNTQLVEAEVHFGVGE
jgi:hypothetical protein